MKFKKYLFLFRSKCLQFKFERAIKKAQKGNPQMIQFDMVIDRCVGKTHNFSDFCSNIFMQNKIREGIPVGELVKEEQENNPNISTAVAQERISETDSTNIWWLSCALYHECRVLDDEAQIAVASVIMNRVKSDKFPNTIFEVLVQPGQYAFVNDEIIWGEPDERAIKNAEYVYWNGSQISENVLFQAEFLQGSGVWKQIDNQYFCYE